MNHVPEEQGLELASKLSHVPCWSFCGSSAFGLSLRGSGCTSLHVQKDVLLFLVVPQSPRICSLGYDVGHVPSTNWSGTVPCLVGLGTGLSSGKIGAFSFKGVGVVGRQKRQVSPA